MKIEQIGPTFWVPEKTEKNFGVKPVVPSYTLKMRKSHKKLARVYAYTHAYTQIRDGGGKSEPQPLLEFVQLFRLLLNNYIIIHTLVIGDNLTTI